MSDKALTVQQHMKRIASLGGKAVLRKRGRAYFAKIAKMGWKKRRELETKF